jgi:hypothetical protein
MWRCAMATGSLADAPQPKLELRGVVAAGGVEFPSRGEAAGLDARPAPSGEPSMLCTIEAHQQPGSASDD